MSTDHVIQVGVDEVGRGCVFGPLVVVAVANWNGWHDPEVKDSKKISSEEKRHRIADRIKQNMTWHAGVAHSDCINEFGMAKCLQDCFVRAIGGLLYRLQHVKGRFEIILDGNPMKGLGHFVDPPRVTMKFEPKADANHFVVSAASLVAKSLRDTWCHGIITEQPSLKLYDIDSNMGYASAKHTMALWVHGPTIHHRTVFVKTLLENQAAKAKESRP